MGYRYKNQFCPTCGGRINNYSYKIVDGVKYHIECEAL